MLPPGGTFAESRRVFSVGVVMTRQVDKSSSALYNSSSPMYKLDALFDLVHFFGPPSSVVGYTAVIM